MYIREPIDGDLGTCTITPPDPVEAGAWGTWTLLYTVGPAGLEINAPVRFSTPSGFTYPQLADPAAPGFVTVRAGNPSVALETWVETAGIPYLSPRIHCRIPYRAGQETLKPGETLTLVYGDRSGGGPGARTQYYASLVEFTVAVDRHGMYGAYRRLPESPRIEVTAGRSSRLFVMAPSLVPAGEPFPVRVTGRDREDNVDPALCGEAALAPGEGHPTAAVFPVREGKGRCTITADEPGLRRIAVAGPQGLEALSNPVRLVEGSPEYRLFWGDTHTMTGISCGEYRADFSVREILDYAYGYAREDSGLDFAAVTDMDFDVRDCDYEETVEAARRHHEPGRFVTFAGYEYCERVWDGDRTVLFLEDDPPIYRAREPQSRTLPGLWEKLGARRALTTPHHPVSTRVGTRWRHHDPRFQRLVEIYSSWGDSERPGVERALKRPANYAEQSVQAALAKGYRLGIVANSDSHTGQPGFSSWMFSYRGYRGGLTAVYARELTREAIFEALYDRRVYGTTHARILLDFRVNGLPMGSEQRVAAGGDIVITGSVAGTDRIREFTLVKNNEDLLTLTGETTQAELSLDYREAKAPGRGDFFYLRVVQDDGERAWSSPVWIDPA